MLLCPDTAKAHAKAAERMIRKGMLVQHYEVAWIYHTTPPNGMPRVLAEEYLIAPAGAGARRGELVKLYDEHHRQRPTGYMLSWALLKPPPKRWGQGRRASARRANMERRIRSKAPLFADELIERELAERPEYFAGEADTSFKDADDRARSATYARAAADGPWIEIYHRWWW